MPIISGNTGSGSGVAAAHGCSITRASGNFAVGNNVLTPVQFTAENYDTDSMHDNASNNTRITIPTIAGVTTGLWSFSACGYTDVTTGRCDVQIRLNGSTVLAMSLQPASASGVSGYEVAGASVFSATNYIECLVRTSGGAGNVVFDLPSPTFECHFEGKVT
jgi:hypothetical protein